MEQNRLPKKVTNYRPIRKNLIDLVRGGRDRNRWHHLILEGSRRFWSHFDVGNEVIPVACPFPWLREGTWGPIRVSVTTSISNHLLYLLMRGTGHPFFYLTQFLQNFLMSLHVLPLAFSRVQIRLSRWISPARESSEHVLRWAPSLDILRPIKELLSIRNRPRR